MLQPGAVHTYILKQTAIAWKGGVSAMHKYMIKLY